MSRYEQVRPTAWKEFVTGVGFMCTTFTPATGAYSGIVAATKGGMTFNPNLTFKDYGEDVDNCPKRTMELMRVDEYDPQFSGTAISLDVGFMGMLMAAVTVTPPQTTGGATQFTPTRQLTTDMFTDELWFVANYSDDNSSSTGGFIAIKLKNVLNLPGFQISTTDREKGEFAFEFHGHYSIDDVDDVPFEIWLKTGDNSASD